MTALAPVPSPITARPSTDHPTNQEAEVSHVVPS